MNANFTRVKELSNYLKEHSKIRELGLNLIASENVISPLAKAALANDLSNRYSSEFYGGSNINRKIIAFAENLAKELFKAEYACVTPVSGHLCDLAAINSLSNFGDTVSLIHKINGGYPFDLNAFGRNMAFLPFNEEEWDIKYDEIEIFYKNHSPKITILGASVILYPCNTHKVLSQIDQSEQYIVYDGSHVLGLIAGGCFQNPLEEGIPILFGSTHKSFPGPQGGLILGNEKEIFNLVASQFSIQTSEHPFGMHHGTILVDNVHSNRIAALGFTLLEMIEFGKEYAKQIVANSKALGNALLDFGIPIFRNKRSEITQSHQIVITKKPDEGLKFKRKLEKCGIFVDGFVRIGTSEITRRGFKETDMRTIAEFIYTAVNNEKDPCIIKKEVQDFCSNFRSLNYCFNDISEAL